MIQFIPCLLNFSTIDKPIPELPPEINDQQNAIFGNYTGNESPFSIVFGLEILLTVDDCFIQEWEDIG